MKRLLLLALIAVPAFAFTVNFIYSDHDEADYWHDEYWDDYYWSDGHWVYYPHGYYCVHYVWWYPWWWDWYWYRCHWVHHFHWDFFYAGFYMVWYEDGGWWYRPRYGRWVRYRLPYSYSQLRYKAKERGFNLPEKPPREVNIPYKENEVIRLSKENDPETFKRIEQEQKSGNLEKMRNDYVDKVKKEIDVKNAEHRIDAIKNDNIKKEQNSNTMPNRYDNYPDNKENNKYLKNENDNKSNDRINPGIIKREKDHVDNDRNDLHPAPDNDRNESYNRDYDKEKQGDNKSIKAPPKQNKSAPPSQDRNERDRAPNNIPANKNEKKSR